jgi:hypothetical protein
VDVEELDQIMRIVDKVLQNPPVFSPL